jgi:hypothetical protein
MFGDVEDVRECLDATTTHFLARLRANSFRTILTALALTPLGRAHIRARQYQFQTHREIDAVQQPDYMNPMR